MRVIRNFILSTFGVILLIPLLTITFCYFDEFQPRQKEIDYIISKAALEDSTPPSNIIALIKVSYQNFFGYSIWSNGVASLLEHKLELNKNRSLDRVVSNISWWLLLNVFYSESELLNMYCTLSYGFGNFGLNNMSLDFLNKPLSKLSDKEASKLIALLQGPSVYIKRPKKLEIRANMLLNKLKT